MTAPWWLDELLFALSAFSIVGLIATFVLTPIILVELPADFFLHRESKPGPFSQRHPAIRLALHVGKNVLGIAMLLAGAVMLVIPGPGLLAVFFGLVLVDLPGKRRLERWMVSLSPVHRTLDAVRRRAGKAPFRLQDDDDSPTQR